MVGKNSIERICRAAGMAPETRRTIDGVEIFIADGFSAPPHVNYRRFGVEATDFPFGCYTTLWWASKGDEKLDTGQPLFFDAFHNPELSRESKKQARINTAIKTARDFIGRRQKARLNG